VLLAAEGLQASSKGARIKFAGEKRTVIDGPQVGGAYKMSFTNFTTGKSHTFGGTYQELTPHQRIRYTDKFDDPNLPGEMQTTIALKQVFCGTELNITQEGVPAAIPAEACYLGWQESLTLLAKLVEAEIPDQP
jgi:uncharacterized protein YndB with AHSA1/START domain